jgi:hypothetical protein
MTSYYIQLPTTTISAGALATSAKQDLLLAELQLKADLTETQPVSFAAMTSTHAQSLVVTDTGVTTLTKPVGAKKLKVMADGANTVSLKITTDGTTPSATVGFKMEPGRSEDFESSSDLKVIAISTATGQGVYANWSV